MARDAFESGNAQVVNPRKPSLSEVIELHQQALLGASDTGDTR
jgi:hypothetical protein